MSRTSKDAATAVDAVHDVVFLQLVVHLQLSHAAQQERLQTHRTCLYALTAADTVLFLRTDTLFHRQEQQTRQTFVSRHLLYMVHRATHHRTAADNLTRVCRYTACQRNHFLNRCTETNTVVTRLGHFLTRHGHDAADERFVLLNSLVNSIDRRYVIHHSTYLNRQRATRNLTTDTCVNQLFLTALRIFEFQRHDLNAQRGVRQLGHVRNRILLVVLNTDDGAVYAQRFLQNLNTDDDLLTVLQHQLMVTGQVRLALHTVHNQHFCLLARRRQQFDMGRETSTTQTDDTGCSDLVDDLFRL